MTDQQERLSDYLFPRPRQARTDPPQRQPWRQPGWDHDDGDSFWRRHLRPPSALAVAVGVSLLAAIVAFVATIVVANVDAGRPLDTEPTVPTAVPEDTVPGDPADDDPSGSPTTTTPEVLTTDLIEERLAGSVWAVKTLDARGEPVEGTAFVAGNFGGRTLLVTSLAVVQAATSQPAPTITISQGSRTSEATIWTWHEASDLALLVTSAGSPSLPLGFRADIRVNDRLYSMAGGRSLSLGIVTAVAPDGIDHNIFVEPQLAGAPVMNQRGEVVAVASAAYNPGGRATTTTFVAIPIDRACERILDCGQGNVDPATSGPTTTVAARD